MVPQNKKKVSDFLERFQGKVSQISKDGHLGVVARTGAPIPKIIALPEIEIDYKLIQSPDRDEEIQIDRKKDAKRNIVLNGKVREIKTKDSMPV